MQRKKLLPLPLKYYGGKVRFLEWIFQFMPPHECYLEPWGGSASILLNKPREFKGTIARVEIYNDLDSRVYNFWKVLQSRDLREYLLELLDYTPYSKQEFEYCLENLDEPAGWRPQKACSLSDEEQWMVERARRYFVVNRQGYGAILKSGWSVEYLPRRISTKPHVFRHAIEGIDFWARRMEMVQLHNEDWRVVCDRCNTPDFLWVCDPPYLLETRNGAQYAYEMTFEQHEAMLDYFLGETKAMVMLFGYWHPLYAKLEKYGWQRQEYQTLTVWSGTSTPRTECLWLSPSLLKANRRYEQLALFPLDMTGWHEVSFDGKEDEDDDA